MVLRLEKKCPKCNSFLMIREGMNGDFLACPKFPACRYTESLPKGAFDENNYLTLKERQPKNPYCKDCNHTGLLPFIKNGRTIANAWVDCECRTKAMEQEYDHFREIRTEDFDYPMSDTFRELSFELYGRPWEQRPAFITQEPEPIKIEQSQPWDKRRQYQVDQMRGELISIRHKLFELTSKKLEPGKAYPVKPQQKSSYQGLVVK